MIQCNELHVVKQLPCCCPHTTWWLSESYSWVQTQHWGNPWHASTAGPSPPDRQGGREGERERERVEGQKINSASPHQSDPPSTDVTFSCLHRAGHRSGRGWAESGRDSHWWSTSESWHGVQGTSLHESTCRHVTHVSFTMQFDSRSLSQTLSLSWSFYPKRHGSSVLLQSSTRKCN